MCYCLLKYWSHNGHKGLSCEDNSSYLAEESKIIIMISQKKIIWYKIMSNDFFVDIKTELIEPL